MKPPVVHHSAEPPTPSDREQPAGAADNVRPAESVAADDGRDVRESSTEGPKPGLVGSNGPIVETSYPSTDGAADDERKAP